MSVALDVGAATSRQCSCRHFERALDFASAEPEPNGGHSHREQEHDAELGKQPAGTSGIDRERVEDLLHEEIVARMENGRWPDASGLQPKPGEGDAAKQTQEREADEPVPPRGPAL